MELIEAVWQEIPDFREHYELPSGLFRTTLPVYDEVVVRELLVNALVHRPYTQRGDIFLNLRVDLLKWSTLAYCLLGSLLEIFFIQQYGAMNI